MSIISLRILQLCKQFTTKQHQTRSQLMTRFRLVLRCFQTSCSPTLEPGTSTIRSTKLLVHTRSIIQNWVLLQWRPPTWDSFAFKLI